MLFISCRSIQRSMWPELREAFLAWLDPGNFDGEGGQHTLLSDRTRLLLEQRG